MMESVTVKGLEDLKRNLMRIAKDATGPEVDRAILGIAGEMVGKMKQKAHPSLRYTIVARRFAKNMRTNMSSCYVAVDRNAKDSRGLMMGRLAHLFEFGTDPRYRKKVKGKGGGIGRLKKILSGKQGATGRMPKRPFFRPVIDEYKGEKFMSRMADIVRKRVERSGRGGLHL